jgi:hypothetical protein
MKYRAHGVDWPRTPFVEAWGELRPRTAFALESVIGNPAASTLLDPSNLYLPRLLRRNAHLPPGSASQKNIQSPQSPVRLSST